MTIEPGEGAPMSSPQPPADPPVSSASGESTSEVPSMVSRAVEGQVGEQRELTNAVTDMRNQLMRLSQELAELRVKPPADESSDAQNNAMTVEMREAVRFLSERLDGVTRMVAQRGEELADIRTALTAVDAHIRSQAETIGVLSNGLQALPSYGERVSVLQDNLQVLHRQLVGIEETVAAAGGDERVTNQLSAIASAITPLGGRLDEISDLGTAHSAALSELQSTSSKLQETVAGVHERIEPIASDVATIGGNVSGLVDGAGAESTDDVDARISESVGAAVRETEQRLMAHVDEAVVALAQMLLKRRPPTMASQITGTPMAEAPTAGPTAPTAELAAPVAVPTVAVPTAEPPTYASPSTEEPSAAPPATEWWERDIETAAPSTPVEADEDDTEDSEPADEADLAEPGAAAVELPPVDHWEAPGSTVEEPSEPRVGVLDADDDDDADADAEDDDEPDGPGDDAPTAPPAEADDTGPTKPYAHLPPPLAGTAVDPPATEAWRPQTPPARNPADPTVTLEDGKKKRRWGRNK